MRNLARVIMRGPLPATLIAAFACFIPLSFWLGCAALALVILRKGLAESALVFVGALGGALLWYYSSGGESTALFAVLICTAAAVILRETTSWQLALLGILLGCALSYWLLGYVATAYVEQLTAFYNELGTRLKAQSAGAENAVAIAPLSAATTTGFISLMIGYASVISLLLARWWQAELYNPGGFGREFKALRFDRSIAIALLSASLAALYFRQFAWLSLISMPLCIAGIALVHAWVEARALGRHWLTFFYITLFLLGSGMGIALILMACADSQLNFRQRWHSDHHPNKHN